LRARSRSRGKKTLGACFGPARVRAGTSKRAGQRKDNKEPEPPDHGGIEAAKKKTSEPLFGAVLGFRVGEFGLQLRARLGRQGRGQVRARVDFLERADPDLGVNLRRGQFGMPGLDRPLVLVEQRDAADG